MSDFCPSPPPPPFPLPSQVVPGLGTGRVSPALRPSVSPWTPDPIFWAGFFWVQSQGPAPLAVPPPFWAEPHALREQEQRVAVVSLLGSGRRAQEPRPSPRPSLGPPERDEEPGPVGCATPRSQRGLLRGGVWWGTPEGGPVRVPGTIRGAKEPGTHEG